MGLPSQDRRSALPPDVPPLQDDEMIAWENETRRLIAQTEIPLPPQVIDLDKDTMERRTDPQMPQVQDHATNAMTKFTDSMVRYQEATLKN